MIQFSPTRFSYIPTLILLWLIPFTATANPILALSKPGINKSTSTLPSSLLLDGAMIGDSDLDQNPSIACDGSSTAVVVWETTKGPLSGTGRETGYGDLKNQNIYFKRTTDSGQTWTAKQQLGSNNENDDGDDVLPKIATDGKGTWVTVWHSLQSLGGTIGSDRDILFSRSIDNGQTWSTNAPLNTTAYSDSTSDQYPSLATDSNGTWIASWWNRSSGERICFARSIDNGQTWGAPTILTPSSQGFTHSQVCFLGQNTWGLLMDGTGSSNYYNIYFSRSTDNGASFSSPISIESDTTYDIFPCMTTDQNGNVIIVWTSAPSNQAGTGFKMKFCHSANRGAAWGSPQTMVTLQRSMAPNFSSNFIDYIPGAGYLWTYCAAETSHNDYDIYQAKSFDAQEWEIPTLLTQQMESDNQSDLSGYYGISTTHNSARNVISCWNTYENYLGNSPTSDQDIFYTRFQFNILPPIEVVSPNGGEVFQGGSAIDVHWRTNLSKAGTSVRLELGNAQGFAGDLGISSDASGEKIQQVYLPLVPAGSTYRIRAISTANSNYQDVSDAPFTITGGAARIDLPNGGETWTTGQWTNVVWSMNPLFAGTSATLELFNLSGKIADLGTVYDPSGHGVFAVLPPLVATDRYTVRITSTYDPSITDESDAPFTLQNTFFARTAAADWALYH